MNLEPIGIATILLGLAMFAIPLRMLGAVFIVCCLLAAAAAVTLPALGGSSITPGHLMFGFFALVLVVRLRGKILSRAVGSLDVGSPGFWLMLTTIWCLFGAYLMPRLMQNETLVYVIERSASAFGQSTTEAVLRPLGPTSGNFTQSVYFFADFGVFVVASAYARLPGGRAWLGIAFLVAAVANIAFGMVDLATYWTGTADVLGFMRNSTYRVLDDAEIGGLKRIVGSFTEASVFAGVTVSFFAYSFHLWRVGVRPLITGTIAGVSAVLVVLATSSTGYAAMGAYLLILYASLAREAAAGNVSRQAMTALLFGPVVLVAAFAFLVFNDQAMDAVQGVFDKTLSPDKLTSQSGVERAAWNAQAMANFLDTFGFGIGIGSATRTSSLAMASLASFGAFGTATLGIFFWQVIRARAGRFMVVDAYRGAAREACLASVIPALISGGQVDMGLVFHVFAALAVAPSAATVARHVRGAIPAASFAFVQA